MENKYSPGPWEVRNINDRRRGWRISIKQDGPLELIGDIAHIYMKSGQSHTFTDNADNGTGMANAHLIAAAPELLAALEGVMELTDKPFSVTEHSKRFDIAREIIAKAKGK